ncbi:hypothetical protein D9X30_3983 [Cupriavidus sp. U2]|uniref:GNAT family N-acetyltransferase n=1 Tax=Cupriavidus sp. U2 TaxID=2920269 RepID=UPI00129DB1A3|nr:GNAT family N-acetyltransferase [Cupriavidus sp. U2]KAI3590498.1 hypothetical protein D9X30_3983 [Cupriavidus sp. U2]
MRGRLGFRPAMARDANALASLVLASGEQEFQFLFDDVNAACEDFLAYAIATPNGRFSWRRHYVATVDDAPVAVMAIQDGRAGWLDDPVAAGQFLRYFGARRTAGIIRRGLLLEREIPKPSRHETLMAHCATHPDLRGSGVFRALFQQVIETNRLPASAGQALVLDVLKHNTRAAALYRRLGFVVATCNRPSPRGLPTSLAADRMIFIHCAENGRKTGAA